MIFLPKAVKRGFTLIELLVVIGVLTILLAIVLVAINPARQFSQANDTQRRSDVNAILNAIHQFAADNKGVLPTGITTSTKTICKAGGTVTAVECPAATTVDLCALSGAALVPKYLADLPVDPTAGEEDPSNSICDVSAGYNTGYTVVKSTSDSRITITATPEITPPTTITVTR